jgi:hypothetical protein
VGEPVTDELLGRADELDVAAVRLPVLPATDLVRFRLLTFSEHSCDFGAALPLVRAMREQVDWAEIERTCGQSPYAAAFLFLLRELGVSARSRPTLTG